jgi:hypothetical protein
VQLGIIAGGLADGSICLWNPAAVLEGGGGKAPPLLGKMQKHAGPVRGRARGAVGLLNPPKRQRCARMLRRRAAGPGQAVDSAC